MSDGLRPDQPIYDSGSDLLNRENLVEGIADQIRATSGPEPMAIALNAPWGAGKSSFLNLLEQALASPPDGTSDPPVIVRFNPWLYGSIEDLVHMLFDAIAKAIGRDDELKQRIASLLRDFAAQIAAAALHVLAPSVAPAVSERAKKLVMTWRRKQKSIDDLRDDLNKKLGELRDKTGRRIVVFIDDIDRLERDITKLLFRLVRLNASFTNMTYVLAFDRRVVEQHLAHGSDASGKAYLEKIVQVAYDIPQPHTDVIACILKDELADIRRSVGTTALDDRRYSHVFECGFPKHFASLRSVNRYVNSLRLTLGPVAGTVDFVDFCVMEFLRVFYPKVYLSAFRKRHLLASGLANGDAAESGPDLLDQERLRWLERLPTIDDVPGRLLDSLCDLLVSSFPDLESANLRRKSDGDASDFPNVTYDRSERSRWERHQRVCSPVFLERYFFLNVHTEELSDSERTALRGARGDATTIRALVRSARRKGKVRGLLDELREVTGTLSEAEATGLARVMCDSDPRDDFLLDDCDSEYRRLGDVVVACIRPASAEASARILTDVIWQGGSVVTVANVFKDVFTAEFENTVGHTAASSLRGDLQTKIRNAARQPEFWDGNRWYYIFKIASSVGLLPAVVECVEGRVGSDKELRRFLERFADAVHDDIARKSDMDAVDDVSSWLPEAAKKRLVKLNGGGE